MNNMNDDNENAKNDMNLWNRRWKRRMEAHADRKIQEKDPVNIMKEVEKQTGIRDDTYKATLIGHIQVLCLDGEIRDANAYRYEKLNNNRKEDDDEDIEYVYYAALDENLDEYYLGDILTDTMILYERHDRGNKNEGYNLLYLGSIKVICLDGIIQDAKLYRAEKLKGVDKEDIEDVYYIAIDENSNEHYLGDGVVDMVLIREQPDRKNRIG